MVTKAKDIMTTRLIRATTDMSIAQVVKLLVNNRVTGLPMVDKVGKLIGIVSEFDVLEQLHSTAKVDPKVLQKKTYYSQQIESVNAEDTLADIVKKFIFKKVRRLPVLDAEGRLVGIISRRDLMRIFYYRAEFDESESLEE